MVPKGYCCEHLWIPPRVQGWDVEHIFLIPWGDKTSNVRFFVCCPVRHETDTLRGVPYLVVSLLETTWSYTYTNNITSFSVRSRCPPIHHCIKLSHTSLSHITSILTTRHLYNMGPMAPSTSQTQSSSSFSSFSDQKHRVADLISCRMDLKQRKAPAQSLRDRWVPVPSSSEDADDERDDEEGGEDDDETDKDTGSSTTSSQLYLDLNSEEKTHQLRSLAEKLARRRKLQKQREEREKRRHKEEWQEQRREKRWERRLEKNDEIMEWRDTFEVGEIPRGIENHFRERSRIPGPWEHRWLVPARTSKTMLEVA